jgi:hypothetical protein
VRRWNPWSTLLPVALTTGVYVVERLLDVDASNALVDGGLTGFLCLVILAYWQTEFRSSSCDRVGTFRAELRRR